MADLKNQFYCPLPFRHVFVDSTGIAPCCQTQRQNTTIDTWKDNSVLKSMQQDLLNGIVPMSCMDCVNQEEKTGQSLRLNALKDYGEKIFTDTEIDFVDYRYSNICNFKCRSCDPMFSHGIAKEVRDNPVLRKYLKVIADKTVSMSDVNGDWIIKNLPNIKRLMFTGGEPTLIPEVRSILQYIVDNEFDHISIMITSNGSWQDDFWFDLTRKISNIHWTISIDGVGESAEIIRHGTVWSRVYSNLTWLAQHSPSLDINTVVSVLNVLNLKPILALGREMQEKSRIPSGLHGDLGCRHQFHICHRPYYLAADNWPDNMKPKIESYLGSCLEMDLDDEQRSMVSNLLSLIKRSEFDSKLWQRTLEYNQTLDSMRNEDSSILLNI
jgi:pyruvate-formate lyase-activating enzyme